MKSRLHHKPMELCHCGLPLDDIDGWTWIQFENDFDNGSWAKMDIYTCPARHVVGAVGPPGERTDDG